MDVVGGVTFGFAESLCEGELCCLGHRRKISAMCLLYKLYHRVDHPINQYLKHFVAARNTRASAALGELALVISRCRTDQLSRSFLPDYVCLWNLLPSGVFSGGPLSSSKGAVNLCPLRAELDFFTFIFVFFFYSTLIGTD